MKDSSNSPTRTPDAGRRTPSLLRDQRGQALPLIALLLTALVAMIYVAYGLGKVVNARIQFQNAADSAALAATAMKANVHNLRTMSYAAMSLDAVSARANALAGLAVLAQIVAGANEQKGKLTSQEMKSLRERYTDYSDRALRYTVKMHRESAVLDAFNRWAAEALPTAARQAAQIGYRANIQGVNERDEGGPGTEAQARNLKLLDQDRELPENATSMGGGQYQPGLGGTNFEDESARLTGMSGKTLVQVSPEVGANSASLNLLEEIKFRIMSTRAVAHLAASDDLEPGDLATLRGVVQFKWYSPRLRAID